MSPSAGGSCPVPALRVPPAPSPPAPAPLQSPSRSPHPRPERFRGHPSPSWAPAAGEPSPGPRFWDGFPRPLGGAGPGPAGLAAPRTPGGEWPGQGAPCERGRRAQIPHTDAQTARGPRSSLRSSAAAQGAGADPTCWGIPSPGCSDPDEPGQTRRAAGSPLLGAATPTSPARLGKGTGGGSCSVTRDFRGQDGTVRAPRFRLALLSLSGELHHPSRGSHPVLPGSVTKRSRSRPLGQKRGTPGEMKDVFRVSSRALHASRMDKLQLRLFPKPRAR